MTSRRSSKKWGQAQLVFPRTDLGNKDHELLNYNESLRSHSSKYSRPRLVRFQYHSGRHTSETEAFQLLKQTPLFIIWREVFVLDRMTKMGQNWNYLVKQL